MSINVLRHKDSEWEYPLGSYTFKAVEHYGVVTLTFQGFSVSGTPGTMNVVAQLAEKYRPKNHVYFDLITNSYTPDSVHCYVNAKGQLTVLMRETSMNLVGTVSYCI